MKSLDVNWLNRHGELAPGRYGWLSWTCNGEKVGSMILRTQPGKLVLEYSYRGTGDWIPVEETVCLTWTPCNYGGRRPWFICPRLGCGRRVGKLYLAGRYFLCRHCYSLAYESQSEDASSRYLSRAQSIRRRLGGDPGCMSPFPAKPKGMHWNTYLRLCHQYERFDALSWVGVAERIGMWDTADALRRAVDLADRAAGAVYR